MWRRFREFLKCPVAQTPLELVVFRGSHVAVADQDLRTAESLGICTGDDFRYQVEEGLLLSESIGVAYPISRGLPILLPYETAIHRHFAGEFSGALARFRPKYQFASESPVKGEIGVLKSFSTQWSNYRYDGVIWDVSYDDNERRLVAEVGRIKTRARTFLEVGCGVGITTFQAHGCFGTDSVGIDLSLASLSAQRRFSRNPFLHFAQASAFHLPFSQGSFDIIYSRGVLQNTFSTRRAFLSISRYCRPGGRIYIWVYGTQSINASALRRLAYAAESCLRPLLCRAPGPVATIVLVPMAFGYLVFNRLRRLEHREVQQYDFRRALHAARDRFTPRFAHRADSAEVIGWFQEAGFEEVDLVACDEIPSADADDYRRNVGVRGTRSADAAAT
jgi:ubiquinone/menaquinone biosynthesis C-methylase UbiE/uncharacterized protein YbaR (Trm112 family)